MLVTFVEKNRQMVLTNERSPASRATWIQIAADLNDTGGPIRSEEGWKTVS